VNLLGKILCQTGKPDSRNIVFNADYPVQIFDIDRNGTSEVIYIADDRMSCIFSTARPDR